MGKSLDWVQFAVAVLATIVIPSVGYVVRLALVQSNLRTRVGTIEGRCSTTHNQLDGHLDRIAGTLESVGRELSGLHAKVDMLIQLNGGKGRG